MGCEALGDEVMTLPLRGTVAFGPESKGWRVPTRYALARPLSMPEPETEAAHAAPEGAALVSHRNVAISLPKRVEPPVTGGLILRKSYARSQR